MSFMVFSGNRLGKAQFMSIRIPQMKVTLAPFTVSDRFGTQAVCPQVLMYGVYVRYSQDNVPPPIRCLKRGDNDIDESLSGTKAAEGSICPPVRKRQAQPAVEIYRTGHVPNGQRHCTDVFHPHQSQV